MFAIELTIFFRNTINKTNILNRNITNKNIKNSMPNKANIRWETFTRTCSVITGTFLGTSWSGSIWPNTIRTTWIPRTTKWWRTGWISNRTCRTSGTASSGTSTCSWRTCSRRSRTRARCSSTRTRTAAVSVIPSKYRRVSSQAYHVIRFCLRHATTVSAHLPCLCHK